MLENDINVKDFNIYVCALQLVIYFSSFSLSDSVDSCADFSQFQGLLCGVEPRWKANSQRQLWPQYQDLGLAIWRLPVDAEGPPQGHVRFLLIFVNFLRGHSNLYVFSSFPLSVSVDSCPDFSQFQCLLCGVEPRWKANCQRQLWRNHQDLGLPIWRLPVDVEGALGG